MTLLNSHKRSIWRRVFASLVLFTFLFANTGAPVQSVWAQESLTLPPVGQRLNLSPAFTPPLLKGIKVYANNPFRLDFILDTGDDKSAPSQLKEESTRLIKYFLASLTVPEKDLWVNLSPYEKDRIVPDAFGITAMGRDLLAEDYILKQITASVIYPESATGKEFWDKVYAEAKKCYGTIDVPINTFNKVWIIPQKAVIYENPTPNAGEATAFVVESSLKVMLEEDYLSLKKNTVRNGLKPFPTNVNQIGSQIIREVVIPILEKEVNEGKNFAQLRQIYHSLILATWFKHKIKDSIVSKAYIDQKKVVGVDIDDKTAKDKIYAQYLKAFKKGVFNYISAGGGSALGGIEDYDPSTQEKIPRKYFSGGVLFDAAQIVQVTNVAEVVSTIRARGHYLEVPMQMRPTDEFGERLRANKHLPKNDKAMIGQEIIFPDDIKGELESLGEKPDKLIKLRQAGFNIPKFFVIKSNGSGKLIFNDQLNQAFNGMNKPVIVRSAHPEEGKKYSYSGVFESFLNIEVLTEAETKKKVPQHLDDFGDIVVESVEVAYQEMIASARDSYRANKYREANKITEFNPNLMNAIVMEQVDVDVFGMFVTSDVHDPDKVLIHYKVRTPQGEREVGGVSTYDKNTGLEENDLGEHLRKVLVQFGENAGKIESIFGRQQIELASSKKDGKVYVFQSRTINLGNPNDVPRYAQYKTMSQEDSMTAIGYGSYHLPVLVVDTVKDAMDYKNWPEYQELLVKYRSAKKSEHEALNAQRQEVAVKAEERYRKELAAFKEKHPQYILVIKDADSIVRFTGESILEMRKDYSFLNGLIANAKVIVRGKNQNAIRHEDWNHVDLGGVTLMPSSDDMFVEFFHHKLSGEGTSNRLTGNSIYSVNGNISFQYRRSIATGDYLNVLSNIDGAFIWYDDKAQIAEGDREAFLKGGINFNPEQIALEVKGARAVDQFHFDSTMMGDIIIRGLKPVVMGIYPLKTTVPEFLGIKSKEIDLLRLK